MRISRGDDVDHLTPDALDRLLEREAPPEGRWARHLERCETCRTELAATRGVVQALEALPRLAPSEGFTDRVMARVRLPVPRRAAPAVSDLLPAGVRRLLGWISVPAAAGVAMLAAAGWGWLLSRPDVSVGALAELAARTVGQLVLGVLLDFGQSFFGSELGLALQSLASTVTPQAAAAALGALGVLGLLASAAAFRGPPEVTAA